MRRRFSTLSIKENKPNTPDNALTERLILTSNNQFLNEFFLISTNKKRIYKTQSISNCPVNSLSCSS